MNIESSAAIPQVFKPLVKYRRSPYLHNLTVDYRQQVVKKYICAIQGRLLDSIAFAKSFGDGLHHFYLQLGLPFLPCGVASRASGFIPNTLTKRSEVFGL
jgi:hypothetical protein